MILWLVDRFAHLSQRHYLLIVVTILVPVAFPMIMGYISIGCLWVRIAIDVVVFLIWAVFVVVVVSRLVERDANEANESIATQLGPLTDGLQNLREEHNGSIEDVRQRIQDLEDRTRSALEGLDAHLGPATVNLRATVRAGSPTASATLRVSGGSRWARIRRWFLQKRRWIREFVWGKRRNG